MMGHRESMSRAIAGQTGLAPVDRRLLATLRERGAQTMEQLTASLPEVSWTQVFLAVDRLSRHGEVSLQRVGRSDYRVLLNGK